MFFALTIISRLLYGTAYVVIGAFLYLSAYSVPYAGDVALFLLGRAAMTFMGIRIPAGTPVFRLFYGGADLLAGLFILSNAASLGGQSGGMALFILVSGAFSITGVYLS